MSFSQPARRLNESAEDRGRLGGFRRAERGGRFAGRIAHHIAQHRLLYLVLIIVH